MIYDGFGECQVFRELWWETCFDVKYSGQALSFQLSHSKYSTVPAVELTDEKTFPKSRLSEIVAILAVDKI